MAHLYVPPPTVEELISYFSKWFAGNLRAKITVTVDCGAEGQFTETHDCLELRQPAEPQAE